MRCCSAHGGGDVLGEEHLRDVLRAVRVVGLHAEHDGLLAARSVTLGQERRDAFVILDRARRAPDLHPPPIGIIHQKDHRLRIVGEIAGGDVLPVAAEIGEGERLVVDHAQETLWAAAVLDVGLARPLAVAR